jgi:hypothetical protein
VIEHQVGRVGDTLGEFESDRVVDFRKRLAEIGDHTLHALLDVGLQHRDRTRASRIRGGSPWASRQRAPSVSCESEATLVSKRERQLGSWRAASPATPSRQSPPAHA